MHPNNIALLSLAVLGGIPVLILIYYGTRLVLRLLKTPDVYVVPQRVQRAGAFFDPVSAATIGAPEQIVVTRPSSAALRLLSVRESGLPYASRSMWKGIPLALSTLDKRDKR